MNCCGFNNFNLYSWLSSAYNLTRLPELKYGTVSKNMCCDHFLYNWFHPVIEMKGKNSLFVMSFMIHRVKSFWMLTSWNVALFVRTNQLQTTREAIEEIYSISCIKFLPDWDDSQKVSIILGLSDNTLYSRTYWGKMNKFFICKATETNYNCVCKAMSMRTYGHGDTILMSNFLSYKASVCVCLRFVPSNYWLWTCTFLITKLTYRRWYVFMR